MRKADGDIVDQHWSEKAKNNDVQGIAIAVETSISEDQLISSTADRTARCETSVISISTRVMRDILNTLLRDVARHVAAQDEPLRGRSNGCELV